jgi:hypothetical protein
MVPVLHDSPEWRQVQDDLKKLLSELSRLNYELTALRQQQDFQHSNNREKITAIEERIEAVEALLNGDGDTPGLKTEMAVLVAYGKASATWAKVIAALLGILLAAGSLYVAYFEAHHHVSENNKIGLQSHRTEDATKE